MAKRKIKRPTRLKGPDKIAFAFYSRIGMLKRQNIKGVDYFIGYVMINGKGQNVKLRPIKNSNLSYELVMPVLCYETGESIKKYEGYIERMRRFRQQQNEEKLARYAEKYDDPQVVAPPESEEVEEDVKDFDTGDNAEVGDILSDG